ncbi:MAG TPA: hypothetical protein VNK82_01525 [Terriglobales bacterium]|nr:hypothetical protein [Terriglobales bacterium]
MVVVVALSLAAYFASAGFGGRTIAAEAAAPDPSSAPPPLLLLQEPVLHGRIVEVRGRSWPNATVMVNGLSVPAIFPDGSFRYFMPALPAGSHAITVTAQTAAGDTKTVRSSVVVQ